MNQNYQFTKLERAESQATLWLNRPPVNILNIPMMDEMIHQLDDICNDDEIRLLIFRGEGRCFSAGMDVRDHLPDQAHAMMGLMHKLMQGIMDLEIPTISVLHGSALGGGLELAMITDLTYVYEGCKLGQPEIVLGVFPPLAIAYLPEMIGAKRANDLILSGRTILAEEAVKIGLVNDVFRTDDFDSRFQEITSRLLGHSKAALAATKRAIKERMGIMHRLGMAEKKYLEDLMRTEDASEGLQAFLDKREPKWRHR